MNPCIKFYLEILILNNKILFDVVKSVIIIYTVMVIKNTNSPMIFMITCDSLFSSTDIIHEYVFAPQHRIKTFIEPYPYRFICYVVIESCFYIINLLTWWNFSHYIYWIFITPAYPTILNYLQGVPDVRYVYMKVIHSVQLGINHVFYSFIAWCINTICIETLQYDAKISSLEAEYVIKSNNMGVIKSFLSAVMLTVLFNYCEKTGGMYHIIFIILRKIGFVNQRESDDPHIMSIKEQRARVIAVIASRKWSQFCNPNIINSLRYLLNGNTQGEFSTRINKIISTTEKSVIKFSTVYSIASFCSSVKIIPVISLVFLIRPLIDALNAVIIPRSLLIKIITKSLGIIYIIFNEKPTQSMFTIGVIFELVENLDNSATHWLFRQLISWLDKKIWKLYQRNDYNYELCMYPFILWICSLYVIKPQYIIIIMLTVLLIIKRRLLMVYLTIFGLFSDYYALHLLILSVIFYLAINIENGRKIGDRPIQLNIIEDYPGDIQNNANDESNYDHEFIIL